MRKLLLVLCSFCGILGFQNSSHAQLYTDQQMPRPSPYQSDRQLSAEIQNLFIRSGHPGIVVDVSNGRVTLKGSMDLVLKQDLVRQIKSMPGVNSVDDRITQSP